MRGESARPGKRPLRALSATEKIDAITRVHEGESKASVARDIGVPESTLRGWCKSEHKIRGMARNSLTPDSDPHSPASSSGNHMSGMGASNLSSEDECGPSTSKKAKLEPLSAHDDLSDAKQDYSKQAQMDYMSLLSSLVNTGRQENNTLLLQQLSLLSSAQSAVNLTNNFLNLTGTNLASAHGTNIASAHGTNLASAHLASSPQTVGLVENGLQYTKTSGGNSSRRSTSYVSSAIAPSQYESVSKSRKSLPPAAEAPSTPVPASPRKMNEHSNGVLNLQQHNRNAKRDNGCSSSTSSTSSSRKTQDEALMIWLAQQQQLIGHQPVAFSPAEFTVDGVGSWFWRWYKKCTYPIVAPTPLTASSTTASLPHQQNQTTSSSSTTPTTIPTTTLTTTTPTMTSTTTTTQSYRKSPSKAKAALDNVLCINNNNNENVRRSLNLSSDNSDALEEEEDDREERATSEEALEYGQKFFDWLNTCSEPTVTRLQILQLKYLLDNLKSKQRASSCKQSRK